MTALQTRPSEKNLKIRWEKLPDDFVLPDDPVDSNLQPLLAAALREALELAGLILEASLIATNFGICATVDGKTVVKAPDWVYIPTVKPLKDGVIRRSYTPNAEGDRPLIVMEFISETEGGNIPSIPTTPMANGTFTNKFCGCLFTSFFIPKQLVWMPIGSQKTNIRNRKLEPMVAFGWRKWAYFWEFGRAKKQK